MLAVAECVHPAVCGDGRRVLITAAHRHKLGHARRRAARFNHLRDLSRLLDVLSLAEPQLPVLGEPPRVQGALVCERHRVTLRQRA
jgi:hypothetical protein